MLGLETAAYYGGGTNDNAPDAQLEILTMFDLIMDKVEQWGADHADDEEMQHKIHDLLYENGV
jgi:hypothetical protein